MGILKDLIFANYGLLVTELIWTFLLVLLCLSFLCVFLAIKCMSIVIKLKQLEKKSDLLRKKIFRQKEYFAETLVHDLKVPTIAQLRGLELLKQNVLGELSEEQKDLIAQIENSCSYILDMISMFVKTYRLENGESFFVPESFNMDNLIEECLSEIAAIIKEKDIMLKVEKLAKNTLIVADRSEIKIVIFNLLTTAILHSCQNDRIIIKINNVNNNLKVEIITRGIILSKQDCNKMFNQPESDLINYTTIGNGIGMYFCKKIIEAHLGKIYAKSSSKGYNIFAFLLPLQKEKLCEKTSLSNFRPQNCY